MSRARFWSSAAALAVAVVFAVAAGTTAFSANVSHPQPGQGSSGALVTELLTQYHFRDRAIDDEFSAAVFEDYFEALDPQHHYFLAADLERFAQQRTRLDDAVPEGQLDFVYDVFSTYQQRVNERAAYAESLLEKPLDFTTDETLQLDRSEAGWAESEAALDELWRKRVKHDALTLKLSGENWEDVRETLDKRYRRMARNVEQYTGEDVFQVFMNAWTGAFDPHTSYLSPRNSENFDINMSLSLEGIGALLRTEGDYVEVVELIAGGPAAKSGELKPGDRIIGVAEHGDEMVDVVGWRLPDVVDLIRGPKESTVRLRVLPSSGGYDGPAKRVSLVRNRIELEEQAAQSEVIEIDRGGRRLRIGVIEIPTFYADFDAAKTGKRDYRSTTRDVRRLLEKLQAQKSGIDGLVIDLRGNAGGSLTEATNMTGLFLEDGPVVQVRRSSGELEVLQDDDDHALAYDGPMTVLVDRFSASASEIFAAAMQDYGRAVILGDRTFGKGTVQTLIDLDRFGIADEDQAGRLKMTIAKFYRVTGSSTQRRGVEPDISLPSLNTGSDVGERSADNALPWDEIEAVAFKKVNALHGLVSTLRERHVGRSAEREALQAIAAETERLNAQQQRSEVSLNEAKRRSEQDSAEAARLRAVNRQLAAYDRPPVEALDDIEEDDLPDVLAHEAAEITADIAVLSDGAATAAATAN